jgi:hypothetical protein
VSSNLSIYKSAGKLVTMPKNGFLFRLPTRTIGLLTICILIAVCGILFRSKIVSAEIALIGLAIIVVMGISFYVELFGNWQSATPFFPAICTFYIIFFGLPVFTIPLAWKDAQSIIMYSRASVGSINSSTLLFLVGGLTMMVICFYFTRFKVFSNFPRLRISQPTDDASFNILFWMLLLGQIFYDLFLSNLNIPSLNQFITPAGFAALGGLYLLWRTGKLSIIEKVILLLVAVPIEIYLRIDNLALTKLMLLVIFFTFIVLYERRLKLFVSLACVGVIVLSFYGASTAMRNSTEAGLQRLINASNFYLKLIAEGKMEWQLDRLSPVVLSGRFGSVVHRTSHLWLFHVVDQKNQSQVPLWQGETYRPLITSFIPRVFYRDKPEERLGYAFGYRYGFIKKTDTHMSINLPWIVELLANFGRWGVIWGMALIGIFLAFLDRVFNSKGMTDLEFIVGLSIIFPLVIPESNFSLMTGSLLPLFVSLYVYFTGGAWVLNKIPWHRKAAEES